MGVVDIRPKRCNLCGGKVTYISNAIIYGKKYGSGFCYLCTKCNAYVGTHKTHPKDALGLLADKEMRTLKMQCHDIFDKTWSTQNERRNAYHKLANKMGIPMSECHFGYFNTKQLQKALKILKGDKK